MKSWVLGTVAVLLWCLIPVGVKESVDELDWSWLLVIRFSGSIAFFLPALVRTPAFWRKEPLLALTGSILLGLNYGFQTHAMIQVPVSVYALVFGLSPFVCAVVNRTLTWNRPTVIGSIFCVCGGITALGWSTPTAWPSALALVTLLCGVLTWAAITRWMTITQRRGIKSGELAASMQVLSLIGVLPLWIARGAPWQAPSTHHIPSILLLAVGVPVAFWLYSLALRWNARIGVATQYLEPILGCIVGAVLLAEPIGVRHAMAASLIIIGLVLQERRRVLR